jgi:hypothetical protein
MTFQDRKDKAKDWKKTREKREELHHRDAVKANHPTVIETEGRTKETEKEDKKDAKN